MRERLEDFIKCLRNRKQIFHSHGRSQDYERGYHEARNATAEELQTILNAEPAAPMGELGDKLAKLDWGQIALNGGPPCFYQEPDGFDNFCLRAERWPGHGRGGIDAHRFVSLANFIEAHYASPAPALLEIVKRHGHTPCGCVVCTPPRAIPRAIRHNECDTHKNNPCMACELEKLVASQPVQQASAGVQDVQAAIGDAELVSLVGRFAEALLEKLRSAAKKYGYSNAWMKADWMDECRAKLRNHLEKGDPRDVAAYCAFLWHHGESTTEREQGFAAREATAVAAPTKENDTTDWKHQYEMFRDAWIRELGGWLYPKAHLIDSLVLTTRARCVNPILGNCRTPHFIGEPTADKKALVQAAHPQGNDCKSWAAVPMPTESAAVAKARLEGAQRALTIAGVGCGGQGKFHQKGLCKACDAWRFANGEQNVGESAVRGPELSTNVRHATEEELKAQRESWVRGELVMGSDADEARERAKLRGPEPEKGEG